MPAKLPADTKLLAEPNTLFNAPDAAPVILETALNAELAAFLTKLTVLATPAVAADITKPAICVPDSFPVIKPLLVNAVCAFCNVTTCAAHCAVVLLIYACKFSAPGIPVNKLLVIASSTVLPSATNFAINLADPGFNMPACSICSGLCASVPTHATLPAAVSTTPAPALTAAAAGPVAANVDI